MVFIRFFMVFCISALFARVGSRASFLEPLGSLWDLFSIHFESKLASWAALCLPSRPPGQAFGLQVGLLDGLGASKLASLAVWASKLASYVGFWLPSWPPRSDFGLQVRLLGQLWASKLTSWASFWPLSWLPGPALGLQVGFLGQLQSCVNSRLVLGWLLTSKLAS